jgi:hypothetical protein
MRFRLTGSLAANQLVLLPQNVAGMWIVTNNCTGSYTVTMGSNNGSNAAAGGVLAIPTAYSIIIYSDGTNIGLASSSSTNSGISQAQAIAYSMILGL